MNTPTLETERLLLRRFTEADIDALYALLRDEEVNTFLPWFPAKCVEDARRFYEERYAAVYARPRGYAYAVCLKAGGGPIGYIEVEMDNSYDFGYALQRPFWGQGLVTEAGRAVVERVRADGLPYITATHDVNNPRSGAVMRRLGMKYCYSYEEQWQPKNFPVVFRLYQLHFDGRDDCVYSKYRELYNNTFAEPDCVQ